VINLSPIANIKARTVLRPMPNLAHLIFYPTEGPVASVALTGGVAPATNQVRCPSAKPNLRHPRKIESEIAVGGISERAKEIKRRRSRRKKLEVIRRKLKTATASEKQVIAEKLRNMTPGAETIIQNLQLTSSDR
jgi:hypothetical protein